MKAFTESIEGIYVSDRGTAFPRIYCGENSRCGILHHVNVNWRDFATDVEEMPKSISRCDILLEIFPEVVKEQREDVDRVLLKLPMGGVGECWTIHVAPRGLDLSTGEPSPLELRQLPIWRRRRSLVRLPRSGIIMLAAGLEYYAYDRYIEGGPYQSALMIAPVGAAFVGYDIGGRVDTVWYRVVRDEDGPRVIEGTFEEVFSVEIVGGLPEIPDSDDSSNDDGLL